MNDTAYKLLSLTIAAATLYATWRAFQAADLNELVNITYHVRVLSRETNIRVILHPLVPFAVGVSFGWVLFWRRR